MIHTITSDTVYGNFIFFDRKKVPQDIITSVKNDKIHVRNVISSIFFSL